MIPAFALSDQRLITIMIGATLFGSLAGAVLGLQVGLVLTHYHLLDRAPRST